MRTRNKSVLIFFCLLLSAAAVLAGANIYSELKERQKEKEDFAAVAEIAELCQKLLLAICHTCFLIIIKVIFYRCTQYWKKLISHCYRKHGRNIIRSIDTVFIVAYQSFSFGRIVQFMSFIFNIHSLLI